MKLTVELSNNEIAELINNKIYTRNFENCGSNKIPYLEWACLTDTGACPIEAHIADNNKGKRSLTIEVSEGACRFVENDIWNKFVEARKDKNKMLQINDMNELREHIAKRHKVSELKKPLALLTFLDINWVERERVLA